MIEVLDDPAEAVADLLVRADGNIVLTGGSSPKRAYELAAERRADWSGVTVWFTDERCVPPDHEVSNFRMVNEALFSRVERPPEVMRMEGELGPAAGAQAYAALLGDNPEFQLMLLGLGPDAHIASLFPNKPEKHVDVHQVAAVPGSSTAVAATGTGFATSRDGGRTWAVDDEGLHASYLRAVAVAGDLVLVSASRGPGGGDAALYRRPLAGGPFERIGTGLPPLGGNVDSGWLVASEELVAVVLADGSVHRSSDAGTRFECVAEALPAPRQLVCSAA